MLDFLPADLYPMQMLSEVQLAVFTLAVEGVEMLGLWVLALANREQGHDAIRDAFENKWEGCTMLSESCPQRCWWLIVFTSND